MSQDKILLAHGSGGKLTHSLIRDLFLQRFKNPILESLGDSAVFGIDKGRMAFTTDSYVVDPIFFPGGDIGRLAVCGTVNDLSMSGARPLYLSTSFIIEEGFSQAELRDIVRSMKEAADEADVQVVCGDTKVVPKGSCDRVFITTSGIGLLPDGVRISPARIKPGDQVIISGTIGDHGIAILSKREGLTFQTEITSDVAPLNHLVSSMLSEAKDAVHVLRDPTRGGLGTTLNEFVNNSDVGIRIYEERIPIREEVRGGCELLGIDPLYVANEGKLVAVVAKDAAERILASMKETIYGRDARIIGEVVHKPRGIVTLATQIGGTRIVDMLSGEQLPRIC